MRELNIDRERWIYKTSRALAKKRGFEHNLTKEFIKDLIADGCSYCGDLSTKMTMDRIDNEVGYIEDNVVGACIRCNIVRGDMPYEAWLVVAKGMKEALNANLFGTWLKDLGRGKKKPTPPIERKDDEIQKKTSCDLGNSMVQKWRPSIR